MSYRSLFHKVILACCEVNLAWVSEVWVWKWAAIWNEFACVGGDVEMKIKVMKIFVAGLWGEGWRWNLILIKLILNDGWWFWFWLNLFWILNLHLLFIWPGDAKLALALIAMGGWFKLKSTCRKINLTCSKIKLYQNESSHNFIYKEN